MPADFKYDVFLSYNKADKPQVRRLAERLRAAGLQVWFDAWIIQPGDDIYLSVERGLEASRAMVLCLSPAALRSEWVGLERSTVLFRDPKNAGRRFIPLLLADCELPDTIRRHKYVDFREGTEAAFTEVLTACRRGAAEVPPADASKAGQLHRRPSLFADHPYTLLASDGLIGRKKDLKFLTDAAQESTSQTPRVICLTAIGGTGKSALSWTWINDCAVAGTDGGSIWWSFYDCGADIDRFITASLAYMTDTDRLTLASALPSYNERESRFFELLASSVVRNFVPAPGDFDKWYDACDEFHVSSLQLADVKHHIFSTALSHLSNDARHVLEIISAHRVEMTGPQLCRLQDSTTDLSRILLVDLESRGLIGWNREKNVIALHPVVRQYVWELTSEDVRNSILRKLIAVYEDSVAESEQGKSLEANRERLILFGLLVQVGRFDDAWTLYDSQLRDVLWYRLGFAREQCVLLEGLFKKGLRESLLSKPTDQVAAAHTLGHSIYLLGEPERALSSFQFAVSVAESHQIEGQSHLLEQYGAALFTTGHLFDSESVIRRSIGMATKSKKDQAFDFRYYGSLLETRGQFDRALKSLTMMRETFDSLAESEYPDAQTWRVMARDYVAELLVRMKRLPAAEAVLAESDTIGAPRFRRDQIRTRRIRGSIASVLAPERAEKCLNEALTLAAELQFVEEQIASLRFLGRSNRMLGRLQYAEDHLEQAHELCLRGGYRVLESEIELELAQLASARHMFSDAIKHASRGFRLAWCDGPPFSVQDVVIDCRDLLVAHGAEVPTLKGLDTGQLDALPQLPPHLMDLFE